MPTFQAPPTWADIALYDDRTHKSSFNPIWLDWFISLTAGLGGGGAGSGTVTSVDISGSGALSFSGGPVTTSGIITAALAVTGAGNVVLASGATLSPAMGASGINQTTIGVANVQTSAAGVGNGADITDDTLFTYSLPINAMSANGKSVRVRASGTFAGNIHSKEVKIWFAGTAVADSGVLTLSGDDWTIEFEATRIDATHVSVIGTFFATSATAQVVKVNANLSVANLTTNASVIQVTGASTVSGAASDVVGYMMKTWFEN